LIIDDYIGSEEDANSKLIRDKQWSWYDNDAEPRLKPDAVQIIVANRRHEEDLVGRILAREEDRWEVIKIPFFATENDPLGRSVGAPLWPEWFTTDQIETIRAKPARTQAGLYGQEPAPVDGDYFKKEHMLTYTQEEYKQLMTLDPRIYGAGDWAVSTEEHANKTCFGGAALDHNGILYILPDLFWKIAGPKEVVSQFTAFLDRRKPIVTWSEKGHISKAWGPFLKEQMLNEQVYAYIQEVTPSQNKEVRATSIQGRMAMLTVRFPGFASWWPEAMRQMLFFPGGAEDDFVDFIAHIGMGLGSMGKTKKPKEATVEDLNRPAKIDFAWIKKHHQREIKPRFADR
jgi:phage terminase large subunit-like protein